jgi:hypothetical protein
VRADGPPQTLEGSPEQGMPALDDVFDSEAPLERTLPQ